MAKRITCCAVAIRRAAHAPELIDRAIRTALLKRKPVYIEVPTNLSGEACAQPGPISAVIKPMPSDAPALDAAVTGASEFLHAKQKPVILVGPKVRRVGAEKALLQLVEAIGCAVVLQPAAKGSFPEDPDTIVNWADVLVCIGTVFTDYSTVGWTALPSVPQLVADIDSVALANSHILAEAVSWNSCTMTEYDRLRPDPSLGQASRRQERLTRKEVARQTQLLLTPETTVFTETGDSWFNGIQLCLPPGAEFEIEMQWGHIEWTIPASFGCALAKSERKTILMTGDGAFQMTAQEVSQMVRCRIPIIILLINNRGCTIEVEIHDGLGRGRALGIKAHTAEQISEALKTAIAHKDGPTLIECNIHPDDCSRELIT
ncbi:thiamine diphosphate-binding protein [Trichoderma compactum]